MTDVAESKTPEIEKWTLKGGVYTRKEGRKKVTVPAADVEGPGGVPYIRVLKERWAAAG